MRIWKETVYRFDSGSFKQWRRSTLQQIGIRKSEGLQLLHCDQLNLFLIILIWLKIISMKVDMVQFDSTFRWMRICTGIMYLWFGLLKFFPSISPAEQIASQTVQLLTMHAFSDRTGLCLLASWEVFVGICFIFKVVFRPALILFFLHMLGTFTPFLLIRSMVFEHFPYGFTLVGQYIFKNLVLIGVGWMLWQYEFRRVKVNPVIG